MNDKPLSAPPYGGAGAFPGALTSNRLFETLRRDIVQLKLLPGCTLSEWEIARQFGVSRQPVREAFIKLGDVGLVEIKQRKGTFVRLISIGEVDNARFLREAIEVALVRQAAEKATSQDVQMLAAIVGEHRDKAAAGDYLGLLLHDETFHLAIAEIAGRKYAWDAIDNIKAQVDRVRFLTLPDIDSVRIIVQQHERIMKAIERRDPDAAAKAMRDHLHEMELYLPELIRLHPDLFSA